MPIEGQIGQQPLQSTILIPKLPMLPDLERRRLTVVLLPGIDRRLADLHLPTNVCHQPLRGNLLDSEQNLLLGKLRSPHCFPSLPGKDPGSTLLQFSTTMKSQGDATLPV